MAKIIVTSENLQGHTFEMTKDRVTVGRVPDNDVRLEDNAVSSHHAEFLKKGDDYIIRDLNSTNGTRVNGQRILETRLHNGDTVQFGQLEVQYFSGNRTALQPLPSPLKKTVDLSSTGKEGSTLRPASYGSSSPFVSRKGSAKSKMYLQVALLVLGLIAIILLAFIITKLVGTPVR